MSLGSGTQLPPRLIGAHTAVNNVNNPFNDVHSIPSNAAHRDPPAATSGPHVDPARSTEGNTRWLNPTQQEAHTAKARYPSTAEVYVAGAGPGDQYKVGDQSQCINFDKIRCMCSKDEIDDTVDLSPHAFADHRRNNWPNFVDTPEGVAADLITIYSAVKHTGLPNCMAARRPVPSSLNIAAWEHYADGSADERELLDFVKFGFPLGYMGPISDNRDTANHSTATAYPDHVNSFLQEEIDLGAVVGPFLAVPFTPWAHVSPMMSRPKSDPQKRRIITDLTFPNENSINAYIFKNAALGGVRDHSLPTVSDFVGDLVGSGRGSYMFTVDVARAYKNFRLDPLDWPLACIKWEGHYLIDIAMPFGARSSSSNMQRVANFIVRILGVEGIKARMYLDDLVVVAPSRDIAQRQYDRVLRLLGELGLPEAEGKSQPPSNNITWLGINICSTDMSLSIPDDKLAAALEAARSCRGRKTLHRRQLESLIGRLIHIAKCVEPARIFISRLLQALRDMKGWYCRVTGEIRADIDWFLQFATEWNGISLIPSSSPTKSIQVDASLTGIGGTDGHRAYGGRVAPDYDPAANITELEAANVIVALHTFLSESDRGTHVLVQCDNLPAVQALRWGKAKNAVLMEVARMGWMTQALLNVKITFAHVPGLENAAADALSRGHSSRRYADRANQIVAERGLTVIPPCLHVFENVECSIKSRSGVQLAGGAGGATTAGGAGPRDTGKPLGDGEGVRGLLQTLPDGPHADVICTGVRVDRIPGRAGAVAGNHKEQDVTSQGTCAADRGMRRRATPLQGGARPRRHHENEGMGPAQEKGRSRSMYCRQHWNTSHGLS